MKLILDPNSIEDYQTFLRVKTLPQFRFRGTTAFFPDEYAKMIGGDFNASRACGYEPWPGLFDYQRDITRMAIDKGKFAVFADCGLGKTRIISEFARYVESQIAEGQCVLIVSPLMVVSQTIAEIESVYGEAMSVDRVDAAGLPAWLDSGVGRIGITNYEALRDDVPQGRLAGLILDESSMLKSHYGKWGQSCIRLGKGLRWKLACTGTPAPNDRIEYANHAVFLDAFPTTNSFLARFFVNRGQTNNRW